MKIRLAGAELFHTDRRTDRQTDIMNLTVALCNFVKAPTSACLMCWSHAYRRTAENSSV